jgi:hypothetical protein
VVLEVGVKVEVLVFLVLDLSFELGQAVGG